MVSLACQQQSMAIGFMMYVVHGTDTMHDLAEHLVV